MKKNIIISGLVAGAIVTSWMIAGMAGMLKNLEGSLLLGYSTMLVAFSLIYVSVKNYRDKQNNGLITFGAAVKIGLMITLLASTIYVAVWLIDYYYFIPDYFDKYAAHQLAKIKIQSDYLQNFSNNYKNPFFNALVTYSEILPIGLLVTLLCAIVLKRKQKTVELLTAK